MRIDEGLKAKDLKDLVLPLISVDEYESRISENAIVVGFLVHDRDAANDLNMFIQKSAISILDTDTSPAPDQHGYYYVFVEFQHNTKLADSVKAILDEVSPLVDIETWKMRVRKSKGLHEFSVEEFNRLLDKANRLEETSIYSFLECSSLNKLVIDGTSITMNEANTYDLADFGNVDLILEKNNLGDQPMKMSFKEAIHTKKLTTMLGEGWVVDLIGDNILLQHVDSDSALLLKK